MVALIVSTLMLLLGCAVVIAYARRRPADVPITWGEAMAAAGFAFLLMILAYAVVPHQWLAWADNELEWRSDNILVGPGGILDKLLPFTLSWLVVRDVVASGIYVVFLGLQVWMWVAWQKRGQTKAKELPTSPYGRPLLKKA